LAARDSSRPLGALEITIIRFFGTSFNGQFQTLIQEAFSKASSRSGFRSLAPFLDFNVQFFEYSRRGCRDLEILANNDLSLMLEKHEYFRFYLRQVL